MEFEKIKKLGTELMAQYEYGKDLVEAVTTIEENKKFFTRSELVEADLKSNEQKLIMVKKDNGLLEEKAVELQLKVKELDDYLAVDYNDRKKEIGNALDVWAIEKKSKLEDEIASDLSVESAKLSAIEVDLDSKKRELADMNKELKGIQVAIREMFAKGGVT